MLANISAIHLGDFYASCIIRDRPNMLANLTISMKLGKFGQYIFPSLSMNVAIAPCERESSMFSLAVRAC